MLSNRAGAKATLVYQINVRLPLLEAHEHLIAQPSQPCIFRLQCDGVGKGHVFLPHGGVSSVDPLPASHNDFLVPFGGTGPFQIPIHHKVVAQEVETPGSPAQAILCNEFQLSEVQAKPARWPLKGGRTGVLIAGFTVACSMVSGNMSARYPDGRFDRVGPVEIALHDERDGCLLLFPAPEE